jgi:hypothetical protein
MLKLIAKGPREGDPGDLNRTANRPARPLSATPDNIDPAPVPTKKGQ